MPPSRTSGATLVALMEACWGWDIPRETEALNIGEHWQAMELAQEQVSSFLWNKSTAKLPATGIVIGTNYQDCHESQGWLCEWKALNRFEKGYLPSSL